jgi:hypothetical protein
MLVVTTTTLNNEDATCMMMPTIILMMLGNYKQQRLRRQVIRALTKNQFPMEPSEKTAAVSSIVAAVVAYYRTIGSRPTGSRIISLKNLLLKGFPWWFRKVDIKKLGNSLLDNLFSWVLL